MYKKAIHIILNIGINLSHTAIDKKKIQSLNALTIIGIITNIMLGFILLSKGNSIISLFHFLMTIGYIITIYTQIKLNFQRAITAFWVTNFTYFILFSSVISKENITIYFATMLLLTLLFFQNKWIRITTTTVIFSGLYLKLNYFDYFFYSGINHPINNTFGLFILMILIIGAFKYSSNGYETQLKEQYEKAIETQKTLDYQKQELKKLNELKSHFLINLSHEIRTPITLIKGYSSKIDFNKSTAYNLEQVNIIDKQVYQIQNIVDTIMDLGKLDNNQLELNKAIKSLHNLLKKQYSTFKTVFEKKLINFSIELPDKDEFINIDELQMERCISNLLSNSLKFTPKKGKVILFAKYSKTLEIGVIDNGLGIPLEDINSVFNRFFQSKNHITKSQGSGIGLSFTKNIIEKHGFSIHLESTPNVQTIFTIKIPTEHISNTIISQEKLKHHPVKHLENKNAHILIVEDNEQMLNYLKSLLPNSIEISEAKNGLEAKNIIELKNIDLIITDYMMPIMDGYDFVSKIKQLGYKTPVIVITARVDKKGKLDMLRLGIDAYLTKPFLEEEFVYMVNKSLNFHKIIVSSEEQSTSEELKENSEISQVFYKTLITIISEKHSSNNFGLDDLADALKISKRTLNRRTKLLLGQTPNQLIVEFRLQKAMGIKENNPNISQRELAKMVGLSNASYLSKRLKIRFGNDS